MDSSIRMVLSSSLYSKLLHRTMNKFDYNSPKTINRNSKTIHMRTRPPNTNVSSNRTMSPTNTKPKTSFSFPYQKFTQYLQSISKLWVNYFLSSQQIRQKISVIIKEVGLFMLIDCSPRSSTKRHQMKSIFLIWVVVVGYLGFSL